MSAIKLIMVTNDSTMWFRSLISAYKDHCIGQDFVHKIIGFFPTIVVKKSRRGYEIEH